MPPDFTQINYYQTKQVPNRNDANHDQVTNVIAIIGLSCRLPMAPNPEAFWGLLRNGINAITQAPADRWNLASSFDPVMSRLGKFLDIGTRFRFPAGHKWVDASVGRRKTRLYQIRIRSQSDRLSRDV